MIYSITLVYFWCFRFNCIMNSPNNRIINLIFDWRRIWQVSPIFFQWNINFSFRITLNIIKINFCIVYRCTVQIHKKMSCTVHYCTAYKTLLQGYFARLAALRKLLFQFIDCVLNIDGMRCKETDFTARFHRFIDICLKWWDCYVY